MSLEGRREGGGGKGMEWEGRGGEGGREGGRKGGREGGREGEEG